MCGNILGNPSFEGSLAYHFRDEKPGKPYGFVSEARGFDIVRIVVVPDKERCEMVGTRAQVPLNHLFCDFRQVDDPNLGTLTADAEFERLEIDTIAIEVRELRNTKPRRIDAFENRSVPQVLDGFAVRAVEEHHDFFLRQKRHLAIRFFDQVDHRRVDAVDSFLLEVFEK